jgi:hypothetical protein
LGRCSWCSRDARRRRRLDPLCSAQRDYYQVTRAVFLELGD